MPKISRREWVAIIAVFVLAGVLRLGYPGVNPFAADEARVSVLTLQMARGEEFITQGISSSAGTANLPASVYAFVPPYLFTADPLIATQYVGLLNILAIIGFWWLVRRTLGAPSAFAATLFLATAPYAVFFSRNIWTQNLLMPFAVLWLILAYLALTTTNSRTRRLSIIGTIVVAGVAFQVHLAGAALILGTLYAFFRGRWWNHLFACFIGTGIAAIPLLPFLYRAACCSPELINAYLQSSGDSTIDPQALILTGQLALNRGWDYLAAGDLVTHGDWIMPHILSGVLLILGILGLITPSQPPPQASEESSAPDRNKRLLIEFVVILAIAPILLFTYQRAPVRLHYLLPALPSIALLIGMSVQRLSLPATMERGLRGAEENRRDTSHPYREWLSIGIMLVLALIWSGQILHSLALVDTQVAPNGINTPLKVRRDVAYSLPPDGVAVMHTQTEDFINRGEPAIWKVLFWDRPHRVTNGWSTLILPPEPSHLMYEIDHFYAWHEIAYNGLMDERMVRYDPLQGAQEHYNQPYDGETLPENYQLLDDPVTFANGLQVLGWEARQEGDLLRVAIVYEALSDPAPDVTLQQFTHFRLSENREAVQPDIIEDIPLTNAWRAGDRIVSLTSARPDSNSATYFVTIGQYLLEAAPRIMLDDGRDSHELGSVEWTRP